MSCGSAVPPDRIAGYSLKSKKQKMESYIKCDSKILTAKP